MKKFLAVFLLYIGWHSVLAQQSYTIPVVVHVVCDGNAVPCSGPNMITDQQIKTAIDVKMSGTYRSTNIGFAVYDIKRVDATRDPNYINYINNGVGGAGIGDVDLKNKVSPHERSDLFYNIWLVNKLTDDKGVALTGNSIPPKIGVGAPPDRIDGTVILASSIQDPNSLSLSHETGHYLGLKHVFEGQITLTGPTGNTTYSCPPSTDPGDGISDTDPVTLSEFVRVGQNNPCMATPTVYKSYTENNIMSYSNTRTLFTPKQIERMRYIIETYRRSLVGLPQLPIYTVNNIGTALNKSDKQIRSVVSIDPNEKVGITSNTAANHVNGVAPFSYNIYFENKNTATAPAQEVIIVDTLDKSKFDLSTFQLSSFGYGGSTKAYIPAGLTEYFMVDTLRRPGKPNLLVKTDAKLDTAKGILTWHFLSLDPQTRELVADPLDGFLPPNITSPQGEGYVSYSVAPKASLTHETEIKNKAAIYFDNNAPIVTNEFLNTLDKVSPVSSINSMPQQVYDPTFTVQWNGSDNGAGIRSYDVYYKVNGGEYKLWQYDVSLPINEFPGQKDSTYSFFSIAKDYAGNIESPKTIAERVVTVKLYDSSNTVCAGNTTRFKATAAGTGFTYQWQVSTSGVYTDIASSTIYSGVNTTELTVSSPPTGYTNYQYRCKISNGTVTYYSSKHALRFVSTWTGTTSSAWETASNWSCGIVPDENTHVVVPASVPHNPVVNTNGACKSLTVNSAADIRVKAGIKLTITGQLNN